MKRLDTLNSRFPVRKSKEEKKKFREYVEGSLKEQGIEARTETTKNGKNDNLVVGDVEGARVVLTAHYDTPATSIVPNLMLPKNPILLILFHLFPIFGILALSLTPAFILRSLTGIDALAPLAFIVIYYSLFYVLYFAFTNKNNFNDNTSGTATLLEIIDSLPEEKRKSVAFIFFDNEEKGKLGSKAYFREHENFMRDKLVLNFDCVGNGDNVLLVAKKAAENMAEYALLKEYIKTEGDYTVSYHSTKNSCGNSDHKSFPAGVCFMACSKTKSGILYTARIHTRRDTFAKNENVAFLTKGILNYIEKL